MQSQKSSSSATSSAKKRSQKSEPSPSPNDSFKQKQPVKKQTSLDNFFKGGKPQIIKADTTLGTGVPQQEQLRISSWNVNGIRAILKKEKDEQHLSKYIKEFNPDIFCINESKVDETLFKAQKVEKNLDFLSEYHKYWNFCKPPNKGYSGVAIFSKIPPISVKNDMGVHEHDQEGRLITLEFDKFYICSTYVPNAGQGLKRLDYRTKKWDVDFQKYLNELKKKKHVILTGDLNVAHQAIDLKNSHSNSMTAGFTDQERESFGKFLEAGWVDTFRELNPKKVKYSFFSAKFNARKNNTGWRLDYFVVNKELQESVLLSDINNKVYGSDHCPIELVLETSKIQQMKNSDDNDNEKKPEISNEEEEEKKEDE